MKPLVYEAFGQKYQVEVRELKYFNGRAALRLFGASGEEYTGECILTATVNLPELECPPGEVWIKNYGENVGVLPWLIEHGFIERESEAVHVLGFGDVVSRHRLRRPKVTGPLDSCANHSPIGGTDHA